MSKEAQDEKRHMPRSLVQTIRYVRERKGYTQEYVADRVVELNLRFSKQKNKLNIINDFADRVMVTLSRRMLARLEGEKAKLTYGHLEIFEKVYEVPTGVILLNSHILSYLRDGKHKEAKIIADGLRQISDDIDTQINNIENSKQKKPIIEEDQKQCLEYLFKAFDKSNFKPCE